MAKAAGFFLFFFIHSWLLRCFNLASFSLYLCVCVFVLHGIVVLVPVYGFKSSPTMGVAVISRNYAYTQAT